MEGIVMAVLLSVAGDTVTIAELQSFTRAEDCHAFARMEAPVVRSIGAAGVGCAQWQGRTITLKFFGRLPRGMKKK